MKITLNGQEHPLDKSHSLEELLHQLKVLDKRIAVEQNNHIIPRSQYPQTTLNNGDKIEIIHAIGGG